MKLSKLIKKTIKTVSKISSTTEVKKTNSSKKTYRTNKTYSSNNSSYSVGGTTYISPSALYNNSKKFSVNKPKVEESYVSRDSIMSECEKEYFSVFRELLPEGYLIQPQVNLASIIDKESQSRYRNELFRNIDFGVFDLDYNLKLLIEINDKTHNQANRIFRDMRVREICTSANVSIVEFWVKDGIDKDKIKETLATHLNFNNESVKDELKCELCDGKLVLRNGKNGEFYGCSNFPKCKFTKNV